MTYEPGQQVLVRGEIRGKHTRNIDTLLAWSIKFLDEDDRPHLIDVRPADVVGPAPASPDEGHSLIDVIVRKDREIADLTINAARLRDALAAAEAEVAKLRAENENVRFTAALTAERNADEITELREALAAAEAERDALKADLDEGADQQGEYDKVTIAKLWLGLRETRVALAAAEARIRALSVEATGTEGGGGHE
jgi:hypothetical protein